MKINRFIFLSILVFRSIGGWAQGDATVSNDTLQRISFSGSVDTYFHKSFGTKEDAPKTSFSNLPGFSLGMINFIVEYSGSKTGFVTDLVFGPRGADAIFNAPHYKNMSSAGSSHMINQMYVYYNVSDRLRLNAGQFNTFVGYEMISPVKNVNYSTSYLFSFGPFNHTGIWGDLKFGEHCSAKLALMNPTDYTEFNPFNLYTVGGQLSITKKKSMVTLNITYGDPDGHLQASDSVGSASAGNAFQVDLAGSLNAGANFTLGASTSLRSIGSGQMKMTANDQAIIESCGYFGLAIYQTLSVSPFAKIGLRTEYFNESNGGIGAIGQYTTSGKASVVALTLSGNLTKSNLCFIPELRLDKTTTDSFTESSTGKPVSQMISLNMAVVYQIPALVHQMKF